jgi:hypothetical protein
MKPNNFIKIRRRLQMSNTKNRALPPDQMARVTACAHLFMDSREEKINGIAADKGVTPIEAATIYTLGALKAAIRRGTARNYREALDRLEAEQVGDRGDRLLRTVSMDDTARMIARINRANAGNSSIPDYYRSTDNGASWTPHYPAQATKPANTTDRAAGRVLGTLYTQWEERQADTDLDVVMGKAEMDARTAQIERNLTLFFAEYVSRLSRTSKVRLYDLVGSKIDPAYLTSRKGQADPETKGLAWGAAHLFKGFTHKAGLTCRNFIDMVRRYVTPPGPVKI